MKKKVTSDKKKEKASLDDFSWLVPRRTRRCLVASLVTVFVLPSGPLSRGARVTKLFRIPTKTPSKPTDMHTHEIESDLDVVGAGSPSARSRRGVPRARASARGLRPGSRARQTARRWPVHRVRRVVPL